MNTDSIQSDPIDNTLGFNNPDVLFDCDKMYQDAVNSGVGGDELAKVIKDAQERAAYPDAYYRRKFEGFAIDYEYARSVADKIGAYPNAFLYGGEDISSLSTCAIVRPSQGDTSIFAFTAFGLVEVSANGTDIDGQELLDILRTDFCGNLKGHAELVNNFYKEKEECYSLDGYDFSNYPEDLKGRLEALKSRVSSIRISYKNGPVSNAIDFSTQDIADLGRRLENARKR